MDPNSWKCQQQVIDDEILALKHRRNALAPISSVPADIIAVIFSHLRSRQPDIHVMVHVTHVCHHWRLIALDRPLLWNRINFTTITPAGATEILARAGTVPLYLEAKVHSYNWSNSRLLAFRKELQTHISHVYHLCITARHSRLDETLEQLVSPAPTLEHLSLDAEDLEPLHASVPDTLFDGSAPKLSSLHLSDCDISWKSPLLKGLTNLEISTLSAGARPILTDWLDALDAMSQLERLSLDSASPLALHFPINVERTITLPLLTDLDVSASAPECALMLAHLNLPALTSLSITATSNRSAIKKLLPFVVQHAHGPQDTEPLRSALIHTDSTLVGVAAWLSPNIGLPEWSADLSSRVSLFVESEVNDIHDRSGIIEDTLAALPFDHLMTLTIPRYTREVDEWFWVHYIPQWPLLTHAHLADPGSTDFIRELRDFGRRHCDSKGPRLPLLTNLELIDVQLTDNTVKWLCDMLLKRVEQCVPLQVLDLRTCYATSVVESLAMVRKLREVGVDVRVPTTTMPYSPIVSDDNPDSDDSESSDSNDDLDRDDESDSNGGDLDE